MRNAKNRNRTKEAKLEVDETSEPTRTYVSQRRQKKCNLKV